MLDGNAKAGSTQRRSELQTARPVAFLRREDVHVRVGLAAHPHSLLFQRVVQNIDAAGDADTGGGRPTHRLYETVVPAAPRQRDVASLGEFRVRQMKLKDRARVIVEAARERLVDYKRDGEAARAIRERRGNRLDRAA